MIYINSSELKKLIENGKKIIIAKNKVYDVSDYMKIHPGGINSIEKKIGKDCSIDYDFHGKNGKKIWKKFCIGTTEKKQCVMC
tara:strand:- start:451 stop:699 length:249 start_codon:yes stop_codon:yes gene_type:complete